MNFLAGGQESASLIRVGQDVLTSRRLESRGEWVYPLKTAWRGGTFCPLIKEYLELFELFEPLELHPFLPSDRSSLLWSVLGRMLRPAKH
ncbi:MAG: hypothetical protein DWQ02_02390 [Bacteroidetes bacterium]|nr:MAG: hypothetical protein DWQ02_02390 [Bacteroidota bacterium]